MATEAPLPTASYDLHDKAASSLPHNSSVLQSETPAPSTHSSQSQVLTTIYSWPTLEPLRFENYPANHLLLPLRRDILHRAVVYEGDMTRQGTASTKWRKDVHGSSRKVVPQKGSGRARAGDKKSPIRKGGGVVFGPHPRDFSTGLQRKVYDLAWRTALSYRYRKGELILVDNKIAIERNRHISAPKLLSNIFEGNEWGSAFGRSTLVTSVQRPRLSDAMAEVRKHGVVKDMFDVDVKDLLETGRIIIEKQALDTILMAHMSDIGPKHSMKHAAELVAHAWKAAPHVDLAVEDQDHAAEESPESELYEEDLEELDDFDDSEKANGPLRSAA